MCGHDHKPYCPIGTSALGPPHKEYCRGKTCAKRDGHTEEDNVAYCCEYHHGDPYLNGQKHCCGEEDACMDNPQTYNECLNW